MQTPWSNPAFRAKWGKVGGVALLLASLAAIALVAGSCGFFPRLLPVRSGTRDAHGHLVPDFRPADYRYLTHIRRRRHPHHRSGPRLAPRRYGLRATGGPR